MAYVDGFVIPVPKDGKQAYLDAARYAAPIFMEYGALQVVECWGDDLKPGQHTDFFTAVKAQESETIVFSWIVWPSREARDEGSAKMMADPRMDSMSMPFDGKRLIYGGFVPILDTSTEKA